MLVFVGDLSADRCLSAPGAVLATVVLETGGPCVTGLGSRALGGEVKRTYPNAGSVSNRFPNSKCRGTALLHTKCFGFVLSWRVSIF